MSEALLVTPTANNDKIRARKRNAEAIFIFLKIFHLPKIATLLIRE